MSNNRYLPWDRIAAGASAVLLAMVAWIGDDLVKRVRAVEIELVGLRADVRSLTAAAPASPRTAASAESHLEPLARGARQ